MNFSNKNISIPSIIFNGSKDKRRRNISVLSFVFTFKDKPRFALLTTDTRDLHQESLN